MRPGRGSGRQGPRRAAAGHAAPLGRPHNARRRRAQRQGRGAATNTHGAAIPGGQAEAVGRRMRGGCTSAQRQALVCALGRGPLAAIQTAPVAPRLPALHVSGPGPGPPGILGPVGSARFMGATYPLEAWVPSLSGCFPRSAATPFGPLPPNPHPAPSHTPSHLSLQLHTHGG